MILMPGVAFTRSGTRLGHGGGYYDGYLSRFKSGGCYTIGLALQQQIVESIPITDRDVTIDEVLVNDIAIL